MADVEGSWMQEGVAAAISLVDMENYLVLHVDENVGEFSLVEQSPEVLPGVCVVVDAEERQGGELLQDLAHVVRQARQVVEVRHLTSQHALHVLHTHTRQGVSEGVGLSEP